jgi:hypothetical protein
MNLRPFLLLTTSLTRPQWRFGILAPFFPLGGP